MLKISRCVVATGFYCGFFSCQMMNMRLVAAGYDGWAADLMVATIATLKDDDGGFRRMRWQQGLEILMALYEEGAMRKRRRLMLTVGI